jgi:hypothetical protein
MQLRRSSVLVKLRVTYKGEPECVAIRDKEIHNEFRGNSCNSVDRFGDCGLGVFGKEFAEE